MSLSRKQKLEKLRVYARELRALRKRLNIVPLKWIPYDIAKP